MFIVILSWKTWMGNTMLRLAYNRADMKSIGNITLLYATLALVMFVLLNIYAFRSALVSFKLFLLLRYFLRLIIFFSWLHIQSSFLFLPYFLAGTFAAALLECMHCAIWDFQRKRRIFSKGSRKYSSNSIEIAERFENSMLAYIVDVITFTESKPILPW